MTEHYPMQLSAGQRLIEEVRGLYDGTARIELDEDGKVKVVLDREQKEWGECDD